MESDTQSVFSHHAAPPVFDGQNYQAWAVRMMGCCRRRLRRSTVACKSNGGTDKKSQGEKDKEVKSHILSLLCRLKYHFYQDHEPEFSQSHMGLLWDYLKKESAKGNGNERTKNMQILNLIREFEMVKMKESETIKDYSDKLLGIVNKARLLGKDFSDDRIIQKILVTLPEKYESKISSLEESKDLSSISLAELVNALQAQEQRRIMRKEGIVEDALKAKSESSGGKDKKFMEKYKSSKSRNFNKGADKGAGSPCTHYKKSNHQSKKLVEA
ncbi:uncharacterized protein LOC119370108 [Jatropha curcas]|uniref:uncharacterized protein LOC119370108 n=1 Tax=Jatropha curcas TaxID=180498 RepID=UPI001895D20D|nr:uncharacterized protein LOC119370108 [Jatropha curcas]